jgi:hypothetical protein
MAVWTRTELSLTSVDRNGKTYAMRDRWPTKLLHR